MAYIFLAFPQWRRPDGYDATCEPVEVCFWKFAIL